MLSHRHSGGSHQFPEGVLVMKRALKKLALVLSAGAGIMLGPAIAHAATITVAFTGTVGLVDAPLGGTFAIGDALSGTLVIDTAAAAINCGTACRRYESTAQIVSATVGSYSLSGVGLELLIDYITDEWGFLANSFSGISGPAVNGMPLVGFGLDLRDSSGAALSGLSLVPPVFSDYQSRTFGLVFEFNRFGAQAVLTGTLTSLSVVEPTPPSPTTAPEPASLALLGAGLLMCSRRLAESRRRRS
jgi:hypothetical protein